MKQTEIEQMCARVAAAWGVEVSAVEFESKEGNFVEDGMVVYDELGSGFSWIPSVGRLAVGANNRFGVIWLHNQSVIGKIATNKAARFLFCMGYDIAFLEEAGVTVTVHEKLEWAMQMRERGFEIEARGEKK